MENKDLKTAEAVLSDLRRLIETHQIRGDIHAVRDLSYAAGKLAGVSWGDEWGAAAAISEAKYAIEKHRLPPYEKNLSPDHPPPSGRRRMIFRKPLKIKKMAILILLPDSEYPFDPAKLIYCDENDNVIYFSSIEEADVYRERHGISSIIVEL